MHRIMIVDDEENVLHALQRLFRREADWSVAVYADPEVALQQLQTTEYALILSDYRMPKMTGVELLTHAKELQPDTIRIILSGYTDLDGLINAINQAEIYRFIPKPWMDYEVIVTLQQALLHRDVVLENKRLSDQVRKQQQALNRSRHALDSFAAAHPELLQINWQEDGSISIDDTQI